MISLATSFPKASLTPEPYSNTEKQIKSFRNVKPLQNTNLKNAIDFGGML